MRVWLYAAFTGSALFVWSLTEAEVSILLTERYSDITLLVALWGSAWFLTYRFAAPYTGKAWARKRLYLASSILSIAAAFLVIVYDSIFHAVVAYMLSTISLALSISTSISSIVRGDPSGDLASLITRIRVFPGLFHILLALLFTLFNINSGLILALISILAVIVIVSERNPVIPAITLEVVDKLADGLINNRTTENTQPIPLIATLIALLSISKLIYMPRAISTNIFLGIALYASALSLGSILGAIIRSKSLLFGLISSSIFTVLLTGSTIARFTIVAMLLSLTDVNAFLNTTVIAPWRLILLSWRIAVSLLAFSLIISLLWGVVGEPEPIIILLTLILSLTGIFLSLRKRTVWI